MTEASDNTDHRRFWSLRPVAFFTALILGPIGVAAIGVATLPIFIGFFFLFSVPLGAPSYFGVFAPLAWWGALKGRETVGDFALLGLLANLIAAPITAFWTALADAGDPIEAAGIIHGFGLVFAPIWAAIFGLAYRSLRRPDSPQAPSSAPA